jgi:hypothetical protein
MFSLSLGSKLHVKTHHATSLAVYVHVKKSLFTKHTLLMQIEILVSYKKENLCFLQGPFCCHVNVRKDTPHFEWWLYGTQSAEDSAASFATRPRGQPSNPQEKI